MRSYDHSVSVKIALGPIKIPCCSCHPIGNGVINSARMISVGWRPSRIASTVEGASNVSRSTRVDLFGRGQLLDGFRRRQFPAGCASGMRGRAPCPKQEHQAEHAVDHGPARQHVGGERIVGRVIRIGVGRTGPRRGAVVSSETGLVDRRPCGQTPISRSIERRLKIVNRIEALVAGSAIADFKIQDVESGPVDELVRQACCGESPHMPGRKEISPASVTKVGSPCRM